MSHYSAILRSGSRCSDGGYIIASCSGSAGSERYSLAHLQIQVRYSEPHRPTIIGGRGPDDEEGDGEI